MDGKTKSKKISRELLVLSLLGPVRGRKNRSFDLHEECKSKMSEDLHENQRNGLQLDIIIGIGSTQCRKINCLDDADARPPASWLCERDERKEAERTRAYRISVYRFSHKLPS